MQVKVPNLGDGIDSAVVLSILVAPGDSIDEGQTVLELETDKAVAPVPASSSGKVSSILVKEGDTVKTGSPILSLDGASGESSPSEPAPQASAPPVPVAPVQPSAQPIQPTQAYQQSNGEHGPTSPSIKKAATRFGIDLGRIQGTGNGGRITEEDVRNYIQYLQVETFQRQSQPGQATIVEAKPAIPTLSTDFSKWGEVDIEKVSSLRKKIASKMRETFNNVPHVTQFEDHDLSHVMALRKKHNPKYEKKGAKMTVTVFAMKAAVKALQAFPHFNASFDEEKGELIFKKYYHIGIAVDTENGLIVPVIKDVDKKSLFELSQELKVIAQKARDREIGVEDLQGGTFTISNLGGLGVKHFTPIVNAPEVAILGMGRDGSLCLSYDHRVIDGADGARFIRKYIEEIENFDEKEVKL